MSPEKNAERVSVLWRPFSLGCFRTFYYHPLRSSRGFPRYEVLLSLWLHNVRTESASQNSYLTTFFTYDQTGMRQDRGLNPGRLCDKRVYQSMPPHLSYCYLYSVYCRRRLAINANHCTVSYVRCVYSDRLSSTLAYPLFKYLFNAKVCISIWVRLDRPPRYMALFRPAFRRSSTVTHE
ncbi:hypothetical protein DPMN_167181 [Dreissena polymorpha]|uniref:Uncharacterized protein n=1 Tax=Dreissena polymorpha TaxID=45954 RepID=A0A9D4F0D8_DREPO|nr:hypothetical protein DPMN_167181 [Dreissena polymorpha]